MSAPWEWKQPWYSVGVFLFALPVAILVGWMPPLIAFALIGCLCYLMYKAFQEVKKNEKIK